MFKQKLHAANLTILVRNRKHFMHNLKAIPQLFLLLQEIRYFQMSFLIGELNVNIYVRVRILIVWLIYLIQTHLLEMGVII